MSNFMDGLDALKEQSAYFDKLMEPILHNPTINKMNATFLPIKILMAEIQVIIPVIELPIETRQSLTNITTMISAMDLTSYRPDEECLSKANQDLIEATESFAEQAPTKAKNSLIEKVLLRRSKKPNAKEFISTVADIATIVTLLLSSPISPQLAIATSDYIQRTESITVNVIVEDPNSKESTSETTNVNVNLSINHSD